MENLFPYSPKPFWSVDYRNRRCAADPSDFEWDLPWSRPETLALPISSRAARRSI
jgi:hypothetical protein